MSTSKCSECEKEAKTHVKYCLTCVDELKNKKYNEFAFVLAELNNALHDYLIDNEKQAEEIELLKKQLEEIRLTKEVNT